MLEECGIVVNRNSLPNDPNGAWYTSGIRLGTPALTTVGMKEEDMVAIGHLISRVLHNIKPVELSNKRMSKAKASIAQEIKEDALELTGKLLSEHVPYGGIE